MLNNLVVISLLLLAYWYWFTAQTLKATAMHAVRLRCKRLEVLMLDDYVALTRIGLKRNAAGKWQIYRRYTFEFASIGDERYRGVCMVLGNRVLSITLQPYRE